MLLYVQSCLEFLLKAFACCCTVFLLDSISQQFLAIQQVCEFFVIIYHSVPW